MKHIKILGTGCAKCKQTEAIVKQVVEQLGIDATVEKVEDIQKKLWSTMCSLLQCW